VRKTLANIRARTAEGSVVVADFYAAPDPALRQFVEGQGLSSGERKFVGSGSKKGPYMVVAEMLVQKN
jgi:hypothetical protein